MEEIIPGVYFTPEASSTAMAHEDRLQNQRRKQALGVQQKKRDFPLARQMVWAIEKHS